MSKTGKILFGISFFSFFYGCFMAYNGFIGNKAFNIEEGLLYYYCLQIAILISAVAMHIILDVFAEGEFDVVVKVTLVNIAIYCVFALTLGFFYDYLELMFDLLLDIFNGVFIVSLIFWYRRLMG